MIVLLTDYGYQGPYVGQLHAKISEHSPSARIIDLMHDLPAFNIQTAATLLPEITKKFPDNTIFVCIVDPGVGSDRKPVLIKTSNYYFVGPDNGLFDNIKIQNVKIKQWEIVWRPEDLSNSFHGRDLFAPIACQLFNKELNFASSLKEYPIEQNLNSTDESFQIIYIDGFGNAITSIPFDKIEVNAQLKITDTVILFGRSFSEFPIGQLFWYKNSMGLVEIACTQANAAEKLNLSIGQEIEVLY